MSACHNDDPNDDGDDDDDDDAVAAELWLTTTDQVHLFERQPTLLTADNTSTTTAAAANTTSATTNTIVLDPSQTFQTMQGFGFALTGGSALHLHSMDPGARRLLLEELFGSSNNNNNDNSSSSSNTPAATPIGISYLRISIGASDLDEEPFSYQDSPSEASSSSSPPLFSLQRDEAHLVPMLQEILHIASQPDNIQILASPWSAPAWMKDNNSTKGGSLLPNYYADYANYFVQYIQQMQELHNITIDAVTVQNEPLNADNNPSMYMTAKQQADFMAQYLGPAFRKAKARGLLTTTPRIIIYDHNADHMEYPLQVLSHPEAAQYIDGTAFHLYAGSIDSISQVHEAYPDKHLYFTEQWIGAPANFAGDFHWHMQHVMIGATRNWCRVVLEWNLASNPELEPHTPGGCDRCLGAVTIDGNVVTRNPAYYVIAHASKFVRSGSVRIASYAGGKDNDYKDETEADTSLLDHVAFSTPDGEVILIVLNKSGDSQLFRVQWQGQRRCIQASLEAGAVGTFRFLPENFLDEQHTIQSTSKVKTALFTCIGLLVAATITVVVLLWWRRRRARLNSPQFEPVKQQELEMQSIQGL